MEIHDLLSEVDSISITGPVTGDVTSIVQNSRDVVPGSCFVAIAGRVTNGHRYIHDALERGAILIVGEEPAPTDFPSGATYVRVRDSRSQLATLAAIFYGKPSERMEVIGVTGTDGKTTTTKLIEAIFSAAGRRTGLMTTVDFKVGTRNWPNNTRFTVLEAPEVQKLLASMVDDGVDCAVLETTSSALELQRVRDVAYDVAVITNITQEHLEVHGSLEAYRRAKAMLFEAVQPDHQKPTPMPIPHACVLNADDSSCDYLRPFCKAPVVTYGIEQRADVSADDLRLGADGSSFRVSFPDGTNRQFATPLVARFNVSNCLAALTVGYLHQVSLDVMAEALARFEAVPGRMERIEAGQPFTTVVDYAHTAESLELVLQVLRPLTSGKLIVVFGSAGERDRVKRPQMGRVAAHLADFAVITDEDPREEDAASILREIAEGAQAAGAVEGKQFVCVVGRREGIARALAMAQSGDTVLLAGKGHEQSLIVGREKLPWDDRVVAREELARLGFSQVASAAEP